MKPMSYYLTEMPLSKGKFMARTFVSEVLNEKQFIAAMSKKNPAKSENDIKDTLKLMVSTAQEIMAQGAAVNIPNFLKISPVIKGSFDSTDDYFERSRHYVGINCTVSGAFIDDFQKIASFEKIKKPNNFPDITGISDNKTGENVIQKDFANHISGEYFTVNGYTFEAVVLELPSDKAKTAVIGTDQLDIITFSGREIVFNITRNYTAPEWLYAGADVFIKLRYRTEENKSIESREFDTKWSG